MCVLVIFVAMILSTKNSFNVDLTLQDTAIHDLDMQQQKGYNSAGVCGKDGHTL